MGHIESLDFYLEIYGEPLKQRNKTVRVRVKEECCIIVEMDRKGKVGGTVGGETVGIDCRHPGERHRGSELRGGEDIF